MLITLQALAAELNLLAQLSHPNISKLAGSEVDPESGNVWLFSSWESNGNLSEFLATGLWKIPERLSLVRIIMTTGESQPNRHIFILD